MNLEDSLRGDQAGAGSARLTERLHEAPGGQQPENGLLDEVRRSDGAVDPYGELKRRVQRACIVRLGPWLFSNDDQEALLPKVREEVASEIDADGTPLAQIDRERLISEITADILGYGPIEAFLADDSITEVMVNGFDRIYVERTGVIEETDAAFVDEEHLDAHHRQDRRTCRPAARRVVADGRCAPP